MPGDILGKTNIFKNFSRFFIPIVKDFRRDKPTKLPRNQDSFHF